MQRWEYLTIEMWQGAWVDSLGRSGRLKIVGRLPGPDGGDVADTPVEVLNELGEQGWEVAGIMSGRILLKRPRQ
jgi:hypothetical protein